MADLRQAAQQALEALEYGQHSLKQVSEYQWESRGELAMHALRAALAQQAEPLTIKRLRDALVASRIIQPAAVEDPEEYDDGVTLHRIEALHRRLT